MESEASGHVLRAEINHLTEAVRETNQSVKELSAAMAGQISKFEQSVESKLNTLWDRLNATQVECTGRHMQIARDMALGEARLDSLVKAEGRQHETDRDQNAAISWVKERVVAILALIALVVDIGLRLSGKIG